MLEYTKCSKSEWKCFIELKVNMFRRTLITTLLQKNCKLSLWNNMPDSANWYLLFVMLNNFYLFIYSQTEKALGYLLWSCYYCNLMLTCWGMHRWPTFSLHLCMCLVQHVFMVMSIWHKCTSISKKKKK